MGCEYIFIATICKAQATSGIITLKTHFPHTFVSKLTIEMRRLKRCCGVCQSEFAVIVQVADCENTHQCITVLVRVHFISFQGRGQQKERTKITNGNVWSVMVAEMFKDLSSLWFSRSVVKFFPLPFLSHCGFVELGTPLAPVRLLSGSAGQLLALTMLNSIGWKHHACSGKCK